MKHILLATLLALTLPVHAQHHGGHHGQHGGYHGHRGGGEWIAPLIIGGVVGAIITRESQPVIVQQPPIIIQQPQPVYGAPYGYRYEHILDANCNCYRLVLVQNR